MNLLWANSKGKERESLVSQVKKVSIILVYKDIVIKVGGEAVADGPSVHEAYVFAYMKDADITPFHAS